MVTNGTFAYPVHKRRSGCIDNPHSFSGDSWAIGSRYRSLRYLQAGISLIGSSANHGGLQHRLIECCPCGRADQLVCPEFFRPSFAATLAVDHQHAVAVRMCRGIAHFSVIGVFAVRARVEPINYGFQIRSSIGVLALQVGDVQRKSCQAGSPLPMPRRIDLLGNKRDEI
jgi:hypothetical protein